VRIAVLSDVHDHVWNLHAALASLEDADALLFCGDLCSPFVVGLMAEGFSGRPIEVVFGNNDGDLFRIAQNAAKHDHVTLRGEVFKGELGGTRVAVNHFPDIAAELVAGGAFDLVCSGHDHIFRIERRSRTLAVNPGTLLGYEPVSRRDVPATFAVYDTNTGEATGYRVEAEASWTRVVPHP
jgi:uncharacterized protein